MRNAGGGVVKHALLAGAGGADIAAGVATDAPRQLAAPESIALVRRHGLQFFHLVKTAAIGFDLAIVSDQLVIDHVFFALAGKAPAGGGLKSLDRTVAVNGLHRVNAVLENDAGDTGQPHVLQLFHIGLAITFNADDINLVAVNAVLGQQLVEAVGVAGLEEHGNLPFLFALFDEIFGKVGTAEIVVNKPVLQFFHRVKDGGGHVIRELTGRPAEHPVDRAVRKQFGGAFFHYCLHRKSSSLLFSPRDATVSANSFMVLENLAPSAAEIHSTRVR